MFIYLKSCSRTLEPQHFVKVKYSEHLSLLNVEAQRIGYDNR